MENINKKEILEFFDDTSKLLSNVTIAFVSNEMSQSYVENVQFFKWLDANYKEIDLSTPEAIAELLEKEGNQTQFFGKIYEWDWYNSERGKISNIFSDFDLPNDLNNPGFDATEHSFFGLGGTEEYQLKAYTSGTPNINENTTPYTTKVVTNVENIEGVERQGYQAEPFMDNDSISDRRNEMLEKGLDGDAKPYYDFEGVATTMGKSALVGATIGVGIEALSSYRDYKNGRIDAKEYVVRLTKAGADKGITAGATAGVMIPVNSVLTVAGKTSLITIPIAFLVHHVIAQPVSAAFGRGEYRTILNEARIYDSSAEMMTDFGKMASDTSGNFRRFLADGERADREFVKNRNGFNDSLNDLEKMIGGKL